MKALLQVKPVIGKFLLGGGEEDVRKSKQISSFNRDRGVTIEDLRLDPDLLKAAQEKLGEEHPELSIDLVEFTEKMLEDLDVQEAIENE